MRKDRVTWRLELLRGWGERLDPAWLPSGDTEGWRRIFETEDLAGRFCAAGGGGLNWRNLAGAVHALTDVLEQYRLQWCAAEQVAAGCPVAAEAHIAAMVVPDGLRPPRRMRPDGPWRLCAQLDGAVVGLGEFASADLAEGAAAAARCGGARLCWAEPISARADAPPTGEIERWLPRVDTDLRLVAFAAEESVADLARAAATGHTGPDVITKKLLCRLGSAAHQFVKEYRTLLRDVWTDMEACAHATEHDAQAEVVLGELSADAVEGQWQHLMLADGEVRTVSRYDGLPTTAASVAAYRAVDERTVRWAAPG